MANILRKLKPLAIFGNGRISKAPGHIKLVSLSIGFSFREFGLGKKSISCGFGKFGLGKKVTVSEI